MELMISFATVFYKSFFPNNINNPHIDDIFVALTNANDISSMDLHEISLEMFNDPHYSTSRRNPLKKIVQSSVDRDISTTATSSIDVKKPANTRDSGFLEDEEGLSGRNTELTSTRATHTKQNEIISETVPTSTDPFSRKLKSNKENFLFQSSFFSYRNI